MRARIFLKKIKRNAKVDEAKSLLSADELKQPQIPSSPSESAQSDKTTQARDNQCKTKAGGKSDDKETSQKNNSEINKTKTPKKNKTPLLQKTYVVVFPESDHFASKDKKDKYLRVLFQTANELLHELFYNICDDLFDVTSRSFESHKEYPGYLLAEAIKNSIDAKMQQLDKHFNQESSKSIITNAHVTIKVYRVKKRIILKVKDNGPGIDRINDTKKYSYKDVFPERQGFSSPKLNHVHIPESSRLTFGGEGVGLLYNSQYILYLKNRKEKGATVAMKFPVTGKEKALNKGEHQKEEYKVSRNNTFAKEKYYATPSKV